MTDWEFKVLKKKYEPLIRHLIYRYMSKKRHAIIEVDDLLQECYITLYNWYPKVDNPKTEFTFLYTRLRGTIIDYVRKHTKFIRSLKRGVLHYSIEGFFADNEDHAIDHIAALNDFLIQDSYTTGDDCINKITLEQCMKKLSYREYFILSMHMSGLTVYDIGDILGLSRSRISQIRTKALEKLKLLIQS